MEFGSAVRVSVERSGFRRPIRIQTANSDN